MAISQVPMIQTPRIVHRRRCTECGANLHNDVLDQRETRCVFCRSQPVIPKGHRICLECNGTGEGVYGFDGDSPRQDECWDCHGRGTVLAQEVAS